MVRRTIGATAERLFAAWTQSSHLKNWWGPSGVTCTDAEVDLRVGGRFRIANRFPDGNVIWISGVFEHVERPCRLVYSWRVDHADRADERVTVSFEQREGATDVVIVHERIGDEALRQEHERGWSGCLDGLNEYAGTGH